MESTVTISLNHYNEMKKVFDDFKAGFDKNSTYIGGVNQKTGETIYRISAESELVFLLIKEYFTFCLWLLVVVHGLSF